MSTRIHTPRRCTAQVHALTTHAPGPFSMHPGMVGAHGGGARPPLPWPAMSPEGMGGLAGHSDLPPPPPGMTTHERLTQLLETEIQHGHLLQALPPTPRPARRVRAARLLSHRLPTTAPTPPPPAHPRTRAPAHPRTFRPAATRWSAHSARSCAGWVRCRVRDADLLRSREVAAPCWHLIGPSGDLARRSRMYSMSSQLSTAAPLRPWSMVGPCTSEPHAARGETTSLHDPLYVLLERPQPPQPLSVP